LETRRFLSKEPTSASIAPAYLFIDAEAWKKLKQYMFQSGDNEINGFGYITFAGGNFTLAARDDLFITAQTVSGGMATATGSAFAKAVYAAQQLGRADELRLQWHSHVDFPAQFSSTDTAQMAAYGRAGADWMVSLVANKREEVSARVDLYRPLRLSVPLSVVLVERDDPELALQVATDIVALVNSDTPKWTFFPKKTAPARVKEASHD
jgi:hypothetical protein